MLKNTPKSGSQVNLMRLAALVGICACGVIRTPVSVAEQPAQTASPARVPVARQDENLLRETWDVVTIGGVQVGYHHVRTESDPTADKPTLVITAVDSMRISRGGTPFETHIRTQSRERADGIVLSFLCQAQIGATTATPPVQQTSGTVTDGRIRWQKSIGDGRPAAESNSRWQPGAGGYFAVEQSLAAKPLAPGERRNVTALTAILDGFATTRLEAVDWEPTELPGQTRRLLRVEAVVELPGGVRTASTLSCDEHGDVLKSTQPAIGLVSYRADRQRALRETDERADMFRELIVAVDPPLVRPHERQRIAYEVELTGGAPGDVFANDFRQQWQPLGRHRARLDVTATWADDWNSHSTGEADNAAPPAAALATSRLIDHDDPLVAELAQEVGRDETDAWQLALQLEELVHRSIAVKNLESAFASAGEVARLREGDCTEHAVLLAALCRARDIPARVAFGLVYAERQNGFLYHMWNEVWIAGRWRPLDATFGRGGVGATHLKIDDSLLDGDNAFASLLPVVNVIGQVGIEEVGGPRSEVRDDGK